MRTFLRVVMVAVGTVAPAWVAATKTEDGLDIPTAFLMLIGAGVAASAVVFPSLGIRK